MVLFVSHVTSVDGEVANRLAGLLERRGVRCWIAPRDIPAGAQYSTAIANALEECTAIIVILSSAVATSSPVANEVEIAVGRRKKPPYVVRLEDIEPPDNIALHVSTSQWVSAFGVPLEQAADELIAARKRGAAHRRARTGGSGPRGWPPLVLGLGAVAAAAGVAYYANSPGSGRIDAAPSSAAAAPTVEFAQFMQVRFDASSAGAQPLAVALSTAVADRARAVQVGRGLMPIDVAGAVEGGFGNLAARHYIGRVAVAIRRRGAGQACEFELRSSGRKTLERVAQDFSEEIVAKAVRLAESGDAGC